MNMEQKSKEPKCFIRGKKFQEIVREDFRNNNKSGTVGFEEVRKISDRKKGRIDILVSDLGDYVAVYEIKATNWDRIKPKNIKKNAWSHQRQLMKYVETYIEENIDVCLGIIYPEPPTTPELRKAIEEYLDRYGAPAYWFNEIKGE